MDQVHATMTTAGATRALELLALGSGHFAANVDLQPGQVSFAVEGSTDRSVAVSGRFEQRIE